MIRTFVSSQNAGFENQVSSITTSGVRGLPLFITEAIEDVITTRLTDGTFVHDLRTLSVPFIAGSRSSAWNVQNDVWIEDFQYLLVDTIQSKPKCKRR